MKSGEKSAAASKKGIPGILERAQNHRIADLLDRYGFPLKPEFIGQPHRLALAVLEKLRFHGKSRFYLVYSVKIEVSRRKTPPPGDGERGRKDAWFSQAGLLAAAAEDEG